MFLQRKQEKNVIAHISGHSLIYVIRASDLYLTR